MKKKKKKKKGFMSRIYQIVLILFAMGISIKIYGLYTIYQDLEVQRKQVQVQIEQEKENKISLLQQKEYYKSDSYIEKMARERLGLVMPNEIIFIDKNK